MAQTAMQELKSKLQKVVDEVKKEFNDYSVSKYNTGYNTGYKEAMQNVINDIDAQMLAKERKQIIKAVNDACMINSKKGFIPYGKDYFNQTFNH